MRKRVAAAIWALALNAIVWIVVPYYVGTLLAGKVPETPLTTPSFIYEFGVLFIALDVGAALFRGKAVAVACISGVAILSAVYLWLVTNGGVLSVTTSGISIGLEFTPLVYLFIVPSIWAAIRTPISYLIWRRAVLSQQATSVASPQPAPQ